MKEIWKPIPGYEGLYEVSNMGRVQRCYDSCHCSTRIAKTGKNRKGYVRINLHKNEENRPTFVHLIVLNTFVGPKPEGMEASHLNDVKEDNRLENLQWMTGSDNRKLRFVNSRQSNKGKNHPRFGKKASPQTRRKLRQAWKRRKEKKLCVVI